MLPWGSGLTDQPWPVSLPHLFPMSSWREAWTHISSLFRRQNMLYKFWAFFLWLLIHSHPSPLLSLTWNKLSSLTLLSKPLKTSRPPSSTSFRKFTLTSTNLTFIWFSCPYGRYYISSRAGALFSNPDFATTICVTQSKSLSSSMPPNPLL